MQFSLDFYTPFRHAKTYKASCKKYKPCIFACCRLLKINDLTKMQKICIYSVFIHVYILRIIYNVADMSY